MNTIRQTVSYTLDTPDKQITPGKLSNQGGSNPAGKSFGFTNYYMTQNGLPYIPVVGEFHFSRFSYLQWEEELLKMKAGGVHIVATYVFWNFHEEEEGKFNWSENRNLRHFVDLCSKIDFPLILRIGPFCHGEVRNGGIPDWVFHSPIQIRSNDPAYLALATRLYRQIARQIKGLYFQEGGPVIAVQLDNEFMHCGAPFDSWGYKGGVYLSSGTGGREHLSELKRIALESGISPFLFTVTAWGGAAVPEEGALPMLAGYAYTPWIPNQPPSREFIYQDLHHTPVESMDFETTDYPVAYCEMAGGMQVSYTARPYVPEASIEAMTLVKLASGSNMLGYYMYHGGSNPVGKHSYMNETSLPKITYDYQSPLGEFGRVGNSYHRIRTLSLFLEAFGELLAPMGTVIPEGQNELHPTDTSSLRWCLRQKNGSGFVFLNNFQDHVEMPNRDLRIELLTKQGPVNFPHSGTFNLGNGLGVTLPFNLNLDGLRLVSATTQLLTSLKDGVHTTIVLFAHEGMKAEIILHAEEILSIDSGEGSAELNGDRWIIAPAVGKSNQVNITMKDGRTFTLLTLNRKEALGTYRFSLWGQERIVIAGNGNEGMHLFTHSGQLICISPDVAEFTASIYPAPYFQMSLSIGSIDSAEQDGVFLTYFIRVEGYTPQMDVTFTSERAALLNIDSEWPEQVDNVSLQISYDGDVANAFLSSRMLTDHIHYGHPWNIGLKEFKDELEKQELHLAIFPLRKGTTHSYVNQAFIEVFNGVEIAEFHSIQAIPHYKTAMFPQV
ncbi:beta-galactosidase [Paenibacillus sp. sgz500992]|uniref:beta-galactosidase n=1 Tax=Paenibacillus sp. sgz500992 TaxID=3242476 RepID=UPI0036D43EFE